MSAGLLVSAWLVGALGGVHCFAMCGGLLSALAARDAASARPLVSARSIVLSQAAYHLGRLGTYALLGAGVGTAGGMSLGIVNVLAFERQLYIVANVFLLLLGASLVLRLPPVVSMQRIGAKVMLPMLQILSPLLRTPGLRGRIASGLVWGLMPCALIYGVLPLALFAGGAWQGALVMLAFGVGTLPNLLATGTLLSRAGRWLSARGVRYAGAGLLVAFALLGIWRAMFTPGELGQGLFCLVP